MIDADKQKKSKILSEERVWIKIEDQLPEVGEEVIIRLVHPKEIIREDKDYIYPLEDALIASIDTEGKWTISPPHPKYDYSPLSNRDHIKDGIEITHWSIPIKDDEKGIDELKGWKTRLERIRSYTRLQLIVDPENEEIVYRALLHGSSALARIAGPELGNKDSEVRTFYDILCDLQNSIDFQEE